MSNAVKHPLQITTPTDRDIVITRVFDAPRRMVFEALTKCDLLKRWLGVRPTVRGAAMNPVDHPHGGGEAKAGQGNPHPVSPWGMPTKGYKTRKNKRTTQFIVRDRRG